MIYGARFLAIRSVSGWITALAVMVLVLFGVSALTYKNGLLRLAENGSIQLELFATYLQGVLGKYESLPELLARDPQLVAYLRQPGSPGRVEALNRYLETINEISNAADTYLMDRNGLTIAASNWQSERPFVGRNFSYRPYFQQAMQGDLGRYFALGTTSEKRGYYFAYPVRRERDILGALVIKIDVDSVETQWGFHDEIFLVSDPQEVIFLTTHAPWRFKTIGEIDQHTLELILKSRRYPDAAISPIPRQVIKNYPFGVIVNLTDERGDVRTFLKQTRSMEEAGWHVQVLTDLRPLRRQIALVAGMVGVVIVMAHLLLILLVQRRQRFQELKRFENHTRKVLQEANEKLEYRVSERTNELVTANRNLLREISERKQTEEVLRKTRSELVHAAKMATLGQLSAGINHELNQPLAAIRSYADNARQLLDKSRYAEADWNMMQISELTERMAQIGIQLKEFSRKSSGRLQTVPIHAVIDGALEILSSAIRKQAISVAITISPDDLEVLANGVLLQQVVVNLLNNAVQAMEGADRRHIAISALQDGGTVIISIEDSGSGIAPEHTTHIFEPFFTTKRLGQGLGLGLTISKRILSEMGGTIRFENSGRGSCFIITLQAGITSDDHEQ